MSLRLKFALLAFMYVATLAVNVALCSWCIWLYYQSFLSRGEASPGDLAVTGQAPSTVVYDEWYILGLLGANAFCGIAIGLFGLRQVRRWVVRPVAALRDAAIQIGVGNYAWRVRTTADDELGQLAGEVNLMAEEILRMQGQLVEQERRAVANQALRCILHNIRSPLTGIRWLAEAISMRGDVDEATVADQNRIVETVDRILDWLQQFRDSLAATSLRLADVELAETVEAGVNRCRKLAEDHGATLAIACERDPKHIHVDRTQFESALAGLLASCIRRCPAHSTVRVRAGRPTAAGFWNVVIETSESAPGDASDLTAPSEQTGDFAMADRVVRLHGGRIEQRHRADGRHQTSIMMPG